MLFHNFSKNLEYYQNLEHDARCKFTTASKAQIYITDKYVFVTIVE